ncbi:hypothetical protein ScPMuIL_003025 [Solemya velum]
METALSSGCWSALPAAGGGAYPPGQVYPPAGATHTTVVHTQTKVVHKPSRGLFGGLTNELNKFGKSLEKEVNLAAKSVSNTSHQYASGAILQLFQTQNVIQLLSRASGRSLQIVMGPTGSLTVDGNGMEGPQAYNATWTVVNEGKNQVRLHNNNNYLTIADGNTTLINMPPGSTHGIETKFQLVQIGQFIIMESCKEQNRHIGVLPTGQLKSALATGREDHAQFGVRVIYSPYGPGAVPPKS